ncbi:MAG: EexN family lipoprotein [Rhodobacteraceae bacterium]|nr:EexN family lipoprotein [Paracoccaceae bacterium]
MMTKKKLILAVFTGPFSLAACSQAAPRSSEYFAEHLDEARQVVTGCRDGTMRGEECANANMAVEEADAKERFRRFRGR